VLSEDCTAREYLVTMVSRKSGGIHARQRDELADATVVSAAAQVANDVDDDDTKQNSIWRARLARANAAYQTTLAKTQQFNSYDFTPAPISVTEKLDINANIAVAEKKEHVAPYWLRTVSGYSWRLIIFAAAIAIVAYGLSRIHLAIVSVFIALVLTAALRPLRNMFDRHMKRGWAVLCTILTAIAVVAGIITFVVLSVIDSWTHVDDEMANGIQHLFDMLSGPPLHLHLPWDDVHDAIAAGQSWVSTHYEPLLSDAMADAGRIARIIIYLALAIFLTVWFLASGRKMWQWVLNQLPVTTRKGWEKAFGAGFTTFAGYARGAVLVALADGVLAAILLFAMRIPLAAPLAVLVFIGAFIPLVGAPAAMLVAGAVALATRGPITALFVILGVALIGQIEGHVLQPFIMGKQVQLHPVVVALSVAIGSILAGIMGAILAVPLVAVGWSIYKALRPTPALGAGQGNAHKQGTVLELPVEAGGGQLIRED